MRIVPQRQDRGIAIIIVMMVILVLSVVTVGDRVFYTWRELRRVDQAEGAPA